MPCSLEVRVVKDDSSVNHIEEQKKKKKIDNVPALSAFVDLYLAIYPALVLWKLQMSLRKKFALTAALGLGTVYAFAIPK